MPKRTKGRANGEGSIYEYPKGSGIWFAQIMLENGRSKRRQVSSQREAREKLRQLQAEYAQGINLAIQQPTLLEWCAIWLETFATNLKPNIKEDYAFVIKRYVEPASIAKRRLDKLTPAEVQAWVNDLAKKIAPQTVRNAHARLRKALEVAVRNNYMQRNVASGIKLARCARASALQRPERSPTVRAHETRHLARLAPAGGGKAHDHHVWHLICMLAAGTAVAVRDCLTQAQHLPLGRSQLRSKRVGPLAHTRLLSCAPVRRRPPHTADAIPATATYHDHSADREADRTQTPRACAPGTLAD